MIERKQTLIGKLLQNEVFHR